MKSTSTLQEIYDNQQKLGAEQQMVTHRMSNKILKNNYCVFSTWLLIGALSAGIGLSIILTMYIKEQQITTSTSTTSTSTSTSTSTTSTTTSTTTTSTTTSTSTTTTSTTSTTSTSMPPLVPPGIIMLWSGPIATVPFGWTVCDGTQGTPDLRDRFILGSGASALYSPTQVGGSVIQTATITIGDTALSVAQMPAHAHGGGTGIESVGNIYYDANSNPCSANPLNTAAPRWINTKNYNKCGACQHQHAIASEGGGQTHTHTAVVSPIDVTPPFAALLYIMKL